MIANLVDNGIRHNERGGFLEVSTSAKQGRTRVRVANSGAQIEPADAQALTEPFRRLDGARGGSGLGLSIVRSVVEAHGGEVTLAPLPEGGLEVLVELPAIPAPVPPAPLKRIPRALTKS
jgi:signal transduction histidine kinase